MAAGIDGSKLSIWMQLKISVMAGLPLFWQIALVSLSAVGLSAVASNTGTVSVLLLVLPRSMALFSATAIGASCDFMLPAGTPPNAIVFGSGYIRLPTMIRTGFLLDLAAVALITLYTFFYVRHLFA
jgi:sodium-dependent dicarboxylate transporter 2/3/5